MKKEILIKQIATEFNVDEIKVSEYFENIFETLASAFIKNKNVNISEFGKFKVNTKTSEEGEKEKTVLFSPVKKFADEVNYNFSDLSPVQIRLIGVQGKEIKAEDIYDEDEIEEIILIDFEEEVSAEEKDEQDEEILIPEVTMQEIPPVETEEQDEEILIPEETIKDIILEKPEEKKEEIVQPKIEIKEGKISLDDERLRIFGLLQGIKVPEIKFEQFEEKIIPKEIKSADLKIISEATALIIEEKPEEKIKESVPEELVKEEPAQEEPIEQIQEEIKEEIKEEPLLEKQDVFITEEAKDEIETEEDKTEEQKKSDIQELDEAIDELKALLDKEESLQAGGLKEEEKEIIREEEKPSEEETVPLEEPKETIPEETVIKEEEKEELKEDKKEETETEPQKSSLELEAELLKMLDERKKIIEEINQLETEKTDDIMDISGPKANGDELPKLYDDEIMDRMKQNVFVEEEGKILEELLSLITQQDKDKPVEEEKKEEIISDKPEEKEEIKKTEFEETPKENIEDIDKLFGSIYGETEEKTEPPVKNEEERYFKNTELSVFDKLLDEPEKQEKEPEAPIEITSEPYKEETTISDLEKMFRSFKTEITEPEKKEENIAEEKLPEETVQKTDTIKTYDDIFNLIEPNGKKKEEKPVEVPPPPTVQPQEKEQEPPKKSKQNLKIGIIIGALILIIIIVVIWYNKAVKQPVENQTQIPITAPVDSSKTKGADSVIYADTNKVSDKKDEGETVYEKDDMKIIDTEKGYYIEFGEFENQFILAKKIKELKDKNITPGYEEMKEDGRQYYKMKIGPYQSLKEAKSVMSKL